MKKENEFKGKTFSVTSAIGEGKIEHRAVVLESFGNTCLVEVKKGYTAGAFKEFGIYNVVVTGDGHHHFQLVNINYDGSGDVNTPPRYVGTEAETWSAFEKIKGRMQLAESEEEVKKSIQAREEKAKAEVEALKFENINFINSKLLEIKSELRELCAGQTVSKLLADKKVRALTSDLDALDRLTIIIKRS